MPVAISVGVTGRGRKNCAETVGVNVAKDANAIPSDTIKQSTNRLIFYSLGKSQRTIAK